MRQRSEDTVTAATTARPDVSEAGAARRTRFRDSVEGLATRARTGDLVRLVLVPGAASVVLGILLILLGWVGAARTARQIEQIPYLISGGLLGLALVFLGGLLLAAGVVVAALERSSGSAVTRDINQPDA